MRGSRKSEVASGFNELFAVPAGTAVLRRVAEVDELDVAGVRVADDVVREKVAVREADAVELLEAIVRRHPARGAAVKLRAN